MKKSLMMILLALSTACGCTWDNYDDPKLPPACFEQDNIKYRTYYPEVHCPDPVEVAEAMELVFSLTDETIGIMKGYNVLYYPEPYFVIQGQKAAGTVQFKEKLIHIADVDYHIPVLRHETFHVVKVAESGEPDYYHEDDRWWDVN